MGEATDGPHAEMGQDRQLMRHDDRRDAQRDFLLAVGMQEKHDQPRRLGTCGADVARRTRNAERVRYTSEASDQNSDQKAKSKSGGRGTPVLEHLSKRHGNGPGCAAHASDSASSSERWATERSSPTAVPDSSAVTDDSPAAVRTCVNRAVGKRVAVERARGEPTAPTTRRVCTPRDI